jgi:hypothetical protein
MASPSSQKVWAVILDTDGTTQLGVLNTINTAKIMRGLGTIGSYELRIPASDVDAGHLTEGGFVKVYWDRSAANPRMYGRIDILENGLKSEATTLVVRGPAITAELLDSSTYFGVIADDDTVGTTMDALLATWGLSGWTDTVTGSGFVALTQRFSNMSVWEAMVWIAEQQGGYLRETTTDRNIEIKRGVTASGITLVNREDAAPPLNDPTALPTTVPIGSIGSVKRDASGVINRIVPQGQSAGGLTLDLEKSARSSPFTIQNTVLNFPHIVDVGTANFHVAFNSAQPATANQMSLRTKGRNRVVVCIVKTGGTNISDLDTAAEMAAAMTIGGIQGSPDVTKTDVVTGDEDLGISVIFNPPEGAVTVLMPGLPGTLSTGTMDAMVVAVSLEDASQTAADYTFSADNSGTSTSPDTNGLTGAVGDILLGAVGIDNSSISGRDSDEGQTYLMGVDTDGQEDTTSSQLEVDYAAGDGGSTAFGWTLGSSDQWAAWMVRVQPQPIYYIEDSTSINLYGGANDVPRAKMMIEPIDRMHGISAQNLIDVSDTLYDIASVKLSKYKDPITYYRAVRPLGDVGDIMVGDTIAVYGVFATDDDSGTPTTYLSISEAALNIVGTIESFDLFGFRTWSLDLATDYEWSPQDDLLMANLYARLKKLEELIQNGS